MHIPERKGKTAALNRAMKYVKTPYTIFSDANSMLVTRTVKELITGLRQSGVGCVAGEKRVISKEKDKAVSAGEGIYWTYESIIKQLESQVGTTIGAAGEIYGIRTGLFVPPNENTILDDFVASLAIALKGYQIKYRPQAIAQEYASLNIREEVKRKTRIAAGGFQVLFGNLSLLNFFKHFMLSFQYFSHKVLRWLFVPLSLLTLPIINLLIILEDRYQTFYMMVFYLLLLFFLTALIGGLLREKPIKQKVLFAPFYLLLMNFSIIMGFIRFLKKNQNAAWEKAKRA